MCVLTGIITALGTIGGALGAIGSGAMAGTLAVANGIGGALASVGAGVAGTVGITGLSTGAAMAVGAGTVAAVGAGAIGLSKAMSNKNSGNLSISADTLKQSPTSLTDTVSKSADKMVDTNRKSNPLSSLRIKQTMNNRQEIGINTANDSGTGLNLGG